MKGKLYKPVIEGFGSNRAVVVADENNSNYEVLHFSIEANANNEMIYREDRKELAGKPIIKLYLKEIGTRKVFFFEDILDTKIINISDIMSNRITINLTRGKSEAELKSFTEDELNLEQSIIGQDFWFGRVFSNSNQKKDFVNTSINNDVVDISENNIENVSISPSVVYTSVPNFKVLDQEYYYNSDYGWFKDSYEMAGGSILSYYIRFNLMPYIPVTGSNDASMNISVYDTFTMQYYPTTGEVKTVDSSYSDLALGTEYNPVKIGLNTSTSTTINGDFFYIQSWNSSLASNYSGWGPQAEVIVSYIPIASTVLKYVQDFQQFAGQTDADPASEVSYYHDLESQINVYGNPVRAIGQSFSGKYLNIKSSNFSVTGKLNKSAAATSSKRLLFSYRIPIGSQWGNYYMTIDTSKLKSYTY